MKTSAAVYPILKGKTDEWREFVRDLNGPRNAEFTESRRKAGLHERTYLQKTPMGDMVIVTVEGDDPDRSFYRMVHESDPFSVWFRGRVKAIHGIDLTELPAESPSEKVIDSERVAVAAG